MKLLLKLKNLIFSRPFFFYVLCGVIGFTIGFLKSYYLDSPVERQVHMQGNPNWVHMITGCAKGKEAKGLPSYKIEGVSVSAYGSFDGFCHLRKATTGQVSALEVVEKGRDNKLQLDVELPSALSLDRGTEDGVSQMFIRCTAPQGGLIYRTYSPHERLQPSKEATVSEKFPALFFDLPIDHAIYLKFVERPVAAWGAVGVPREFAIRSPLASEAGMPQQKLATQSANSVVLSFYENIKAEARDQLRPDFYINGNPLQFSLASGAFSISALRRHGDFDIAIPEADNMMEVCLDRDSQVPFDLALTPARLDSTDSSWFGVRGGVNHLFFTGPNCFISLGRDQHHLKPTDRVELSGNIVLSLEFEAGEMPVMQLDGIAGSCLVNGQELLPTPWQLITPSVRGGIVGGIVGGVIGFLLSLVIVMVKGKRGLIEKGMGGAG